jgi:hypothetical protein
MRHTKANIILEEFNIGAFLGRKDVEKVTLNIDVDGQGFVQKTSIPLFLVMFIN